MAPARRRLPCHISSIPRPGDSPSRFPTAVFSALVLGLVPAFLIGAPAAAAEPDPVPVAVPVAGASRYLWIPVAICLLIVVIEVMRSRRLRKSGPAERYIVNVASPTRQDDQRPS